MNKTVLIALIISVFIIGIINNVNFNNVNFNIENTNTDITHIAQNEDNKQSAKTYVNVICSNKYKQHIKHTHNYYNVCYIGEYGIPEYVIYTLTKEDAEMSEKRSNRSDKFHQCEIVKSKSLISATSNDYTKSGYDRGHMCPNNDRDYSDKAAFETFSMCNMCPQKHALNAGIWKTTEEYGHKLAKEFGSVIIITGPIIENTPKKLKDRIVIPNAFFKIYVVNNIIRESVIIPNTENGIKKTVKYYHTDIKDIEQKTGLKFNISYNTKTNYKKLN